jgi:hypothetical protein
MRAEDGVVGGIAEEELGGAQRLRKSATEFLEPST